MGALFSCCNKLSNELDEKLVESAVNAPTEPDKCTEGTGELQKRIPSAISMNYINNTDNLIEDNEKKSKKRNVPITNYEIFPYLRHHLIDFRYDPEFVISQDPSISIVVGEHKSFSLALFGDTDTGKTTFFNQFRLCIEDFSDNERKSYISRIIVIIIDTIQQVVQNLRSNNQIVDFENEDLIEELLDIKVKDVRKNTQMTPNLLDKLLTIWNDPVISTNYEQKWKPLHLCQFIPFFISKVSDYKNPGYLPTNEEILKVRMATINNNLNNRFTDDNPLTHSLPIAVSPQILDININLLNVLFKDAGGMQKQRNKWPEISFEGCLFFVSLGDYNQAPIVDDTTTSSNNQNAAHTYRIQESIQIFHETVQNFFNQPHVPLYVIFTKYDLFVEDIQNNPDSFRQVFPQYEGEIEPDLCQKFIANLLVKDALECKRDLHIKICTSQNLLIKDSVFEVISRIINNILSLKKKM